MKLHTLQILQILLKMTFAGSWSVVRGAVLCSVLHCGVVWCGVRVVRGVRVLRCCAYVMCVVCVVCCVVFCVCVCTCGVWCGLLCGVVWCCGVVRSWCGLARGKTPVCRFKTPLCVRSGRLRVYGQHARMCSLQVSDECELHSKLPLCVVALRPRGETFLAGKCKGGLLSPSLIEWWCLSLPKF